MIVPQGISSDLGKYECREFLMFYIQVITAKCFQELVPFKLTCTLGPIVPYGNEFHNLISYWVDKY